MERILITGANSFIGRNFIFNSNHRNVEEISLFENKPENIDFTRYDIIIHLVAIVHQSRKINEDQYYKINRDLCLRVAEYAKEAGVKQFVFLSTVKVYGEFIPNSGPWQEQSPCFPDDFYGKSKYEAELGLQQMEDSSFIVSIIRTPLVYGVGVKANMLSILRLVDKFPILPLAHVNNKRSFTSAENLVGFIDRIIEKKASGIFIAMDNNPLSTTDLVKCIAKYLDKRIYLFKIPDLFIRIGTYLIPNIFDRLFGSFEMDNSRTLNMLDFKPPLSSEKGIKKMVDAYKNNDY